MKKYILLLLSLVLFVTEVRAQGAPYPNFHNTTQLVEFTTTKAGGQDFSFTLAPDMTTGRPQYPIVFIDWNGNGNRQMINLVQEETFVVKVPSDRVVKITGENGLWTVKAVDQSITKAVTSAASILQHLHLDKNLLGKQGSGGSDFKTNRELKTLSVPNNYYKTLDVKLNTKLVKLNASSNLLATLDLNGLSLLTDLDLSKNLLTALSSFPQNVYSNIDLRVNKFKISTLPALPNGTPASAYHYGLQERYVLPQNRLTVGKDWIDLSPELRAKGVATSQKTTKYTWYVEDNAATDRYTRLQEDVDYEVVNGKTRFLRNVRGNLFVAMSTEAFPHFDSFERLTGAFTATGDEHIKTRHGHSDSEELYTRIADKYNNSEPIYRSNTLSLKYNLWYGGTDNTWSKTENWTGNYVPKTLKSDGAKVEEVEFATKANNNGNPALRNLHVAPGEDRVVTNLINKSESGKGVVVSAGSSLCVKDKVEVDKATTSSYGTADPAYRFLLKSIPEKPNGALFFDAPEKNKDLFVTVEFYTKGYDGNFDKQHAKWQYFGTPIVGGSVEKAFPSSAIVRKYNQSKNDEYDEKWVATRPTDILTPFHGYEVTQPVPATYIFRGKLNLEAPNNLEVAAKATGVLYGAFNSFANSYTASYNIPSIGFGAGLEQTVFLYNTGSRIEWLAHNQDESSTLVGTYLSVPKNLAGNGGLPREIPSLQGFMICNKGTAKASLTMPYSGIVKEKASGVLRAGDEEDVREFLHIDVASNEGADRLFVFRKEGTTAGFDNGWDGSKIFVGDRPQLYVISSEGPLQVATSAQIEGLPIGFEAPKDGAYTLSFRVSPELQGRYPSLCLRDRVTGTLTPVGQTISYTFVTTKSLDKHRFDLVTEGEDSLSPATEPIRVVGLGDTRVLVDNTTALDSKVLVFDATGALVLQAEVPARSGKEYSLPLPGTYVVKVVNNQTSTIAKVLLP
ncbi:T9SS type A sorting domain-containing protein [Porphyromonas endodontalis]